MALPATEGRVSSPPLRLATAGRSDFFTRHHAVALIDQAVVSGVSFSTVALIANWGGASELGIYSTILAVLLTIFSVHNALVLVPYSVQTHAPLGTPEEHAGSFLIFSIMLGGGFALAAIAIGLLSFIVTNQQYPAVAAFALAAAIPFTLLREFARFHLFAHLQVERAFLLDVLFAVIQVGGLLLLGYSGHMNALTAVGLLALASAFGVVLWICLARQNIKFNFSWLHQTRARTWSLGGWLLVNQVLMQVQRYAPTWLLIVLAGPELTGIYAACLSIVAFSNPVVFGLGNVLTPRAMQALKSGGRSGLRAQATQDGILLGAVMAIFFAFVFVAGESLLHLFYRGLDATNASRVLPVLAAAGFISAIGMPAANGLASVQQPRSAVTTGLAAAALTLVLGALLLHFFGLVGVAYGLLLGTAVGTFGWWTTLIKLCRLEST